MSSNPLPPEVKSPPGGIRTRGGRRPLSRRRWRQRDYMARFGQYAESRGYDVATRMEDGDMRAVVITREPHTDSLVDFARHHGNVGPMGVEWAYWKITKAVPQCPPNEVWKLLNRLAESATLCGYTFLDVVDIAAESARRYQYSNEMKEARCR